MIKPVGGLLLVKRNQSADKTTKSGLVISAALSESDMKTGTIIDMGAGEQNYLGDLIPIIDLNIGDTVYYTERSATEIEDEDSSKYDLISSKKDLKRSKKRKHKQLAYSILVEEITKNMEKASEPS
jgi:co-chaperonin GroES (HSP10)